MAQARLVFPGEFLSYQGHVGRRVRATARWARRIGIVLGVSAPVACAQVPALRGTAPEVKTLTEGHVEYDATCAPCHGSEGRGDGPRAASLQVPTPDLTRLSERNGGTFPGAHVRAVITGEYTLAAHGSREMPIWGVRFDSAGEGGPAVATLYAERRLGLLTAYLESIQVPQ